MATFVSNGLLGSSSSGFGESSLLSLEPNGFLAELPPSPPRTEDSSLGGFGLESNGLLEDLGLGTLGMKRIVYLCGLALKLRVKASSSSSSSALEQLDLDSQTDLPTISELLGAPSGSGDLTSSTRVNSTVRAMTFNGKALFLKRKIPKRKLDSVGHSSDPLLSN
jgi:hypothetical protein